jgi:hypothetical protein
MIFYVNTFFCEANISHSYVKEKRHWKGWKRPDARPEKRGRGSSSRSRSPLGGVLNFYYFWPSRENGNRSEIASANSGFAQGRFFT